MTNTIANIKRDLKLVKAQVIEALGDLATLLTNTGSIDWGDITSILGFVDDIDWTDITTIITNTTDIDWTDITEIGNVMSGVGVDFNSWVAAVKTQLGLNDITVIGVRDAIVAATPGSGWIAAVQNGLSVFTAGTSLTAAPGAAFLTAILNSLQGAGSFLENINNLATGVNAAMDTFISAFWNRLTANTSLMDSVINAIGNRLLVLINTDQSTHNIWTLIANLAARRS